MGKYIPFKRGPVRSLQNALEEAEEDHYVDCPDAPYLLRGAAFILDSIFLLLLVSSFNRVAMAAYIYFAHAPAQEVHFPIFFSSFLIASDVTLVYVYALWTVFRFGGTPAKLIFNLQVVDSQTGRKLEFFQIFVREVLGKSVGVALLGFGFWLPLIRKDRRAFHDLISSSSVKKVDEGVR